jgi:hypothetical protein
MGRTYEGMIEIPLEEFWAFVEKYNTSSGDEVAYGVPRVNKGNHCVEIDFAASSDGPPADWAEPPKAVTQWKE